MAIVTAAWIFADGDQCDISVEVENDYPDALSQAASTCIDLLWQALSAGIRSQDTDED